MNSSKAWKEKMNKKNPYVKIRPFNAYGYSDFQTWLFIKYRDRKHILFERRWLIKRKYNHDGSVWFGVESLVPTHENGIDGIQKEMEMAKKAIKILKKDWQKYLNN